MKPGKTIRNMARSVRERLLNLKKKTGGNYEQIAMRYVHERFLHRLSGSPYKGNLILKGGSLLYFHLGTLSRPTRDIDFMGLDISNDKEYLKKVVREICAIEENDGIGFDTGSARTEDITVDNKYPGVRITLIAYIGEMRINMKFDIGFGDIITPAPESITLPGMLDGFEAPTVAAYPLETVFAEKLETVVSKGVLNSRMKDFYDLYRMSTLRSCDESILKEAISATFSNRSTSLDMAGTLFSDDFRNHEELKMRWKYFSGEMGDDSLPGFEQIVDVIRDYVKRGVFLVNS